MDDMLVRLIWLQRGLQRDTYGHDFTKMTNDQIVQYVRDQQQSAVTELGEALNEVDWKPWTSGPRTVRRDAYLGELIDTLHFWINMVLAVSGQMQPREIADEIFTRFALKNRVNVQRQVDGYDGRSTKCGGCGRATDDLGVNCTRVGDQGWCEIRNADINYPQVTTEQGDPGLLVVAPIKPAICSICDFEIGEHGCEPPTPERWGFCMANVSTPKNIPPIKLPTEA